MSNAGQLVIGDVEEELEVGPPLGSFYTRDSGLYLLPEPVPSNGTITEMRAFGILSDRNYELFLKNQLDHFSASLYLFFAVFRLDANNGSYQLIHGPEMATHTVTDPAVAGSLEWPVRAGDRIGAVVPDGCFNRTSLLPFPCPSRFNFRTSENPCSAGLYSSVNMSSADIELLDDIPAGQFVEEQVMLNVEASINVSIEALARLNISINEPTASTTGIPSSLVRTYDT